MTSTSADPPRALSFRSRFLRWRNRLIASPAFQSRAASNPFTRRIARRDAERLYDLVSGFVYSQILLACVRLDLFDRIRDGEAETAELAMRCGMSNAAMERLCQAAAALDLMERAGQGRYRLGRLGAAVRGVPGLDDMIAHHAMFYRDIADPVALLRGEADPELSRFWPYVLGDSASEDQEVAAEYTALMTSSQVLVSEETLGSIDLSGTRSLLDVGGGSGAFLSAVERRWPEIDLHLFDLPQVVARATNPRLTLHPGSFRVGPLPEGHEVCALVRVLYDHDDETVRNLLRRVFAALPSGGRVLISEPMSGGDRPNRAGDAYFGLYTLAMTTGRPRSVAQHTALLREAGFRHVKSHRTQRPFITGVISATRS